MVSVQGRKTTRRLVRWLLFLVPLAALAAGCQTTEEALRLAQLPPSGRAGQLVAVWQPSVQFFPDTMNNGRQTPALSGRIYLYDVQKGTPIVADGSLSISVFDDHPRLGPNGDPIPLQIWNITPECMKLIQARDGLLGWHYSLNLPWDTYRPDIGTVHFMVRFDPPKESKDQFPVFANSDVVALQNNGGGAAQSMVQNASRYSQAGFQFAGGQPSSAMQINAAVQSSAPQSLIGSSPSPSQMNGGTPQTIQPVGGMMPQNQFPVNARAAQYPAQSNPGLPSVVMQMTPNSNPAATPPANYGSPIMTPVSNGNPAATPPANCGSPIMTPASNGSIPTQVQVSVIPTPPQLEFSGAAAQGAGRMNAANAQALTPGNGGGQQTPMPFIPALGPNGGMQR